MKTSRVLLLSPVVMAAIITVTFLQAVEAGGHRATEKRYFLRGRNKSWHSGWYNPDVGRPVPLVVPPSLVAVKAIVSEPMKFALGV